MNYLLYGLEDFLINNEIDKIIKKEKIDDLSINHYDLTIDSIKSIIDDCQTISLFEDKKINIIDNCNYFNRLPNKEEDINMLLDYITNYNPSTILIIISHNETIDNTKKITKKLKDNGVIIECNKVEPIIIAKKLLDGYKINDLNLHLLLDRVGMDTGILVQEIEKLKTYKYDEKEITKEDILACSIDNIDTNIYKFIDNIISKKKDEALKTYYELLKNNENPSNIIGLLASKFRLMYQVVILNKKGMNNNEISKLLGVHAYPVKLALESSKRYPEKVLLKYLKSLANLDLDIKTGKINPELAIELFILNV